MDLIEWILPSLQPMFIGLEDLMRFFLVAGTTHFTEQRDFIRRCTSIDSYRCHPQRFFMLSTRQPTS